MNKYFIEFIGTLFFIFVNLATKNAIAIGAALAIAIILGGPISGGNFNPAVSVMMFAVGKLPSADLIPYILAQATGGIAALELYKRFY
jgi:glycerol uptake facilitator-like aquaporin